MPGRLCGVRPAEGEEGCAGIPGALCSVVDCGPPGSCVHGVSGQGRSPGALSEFGVSGSRDLEGSWRVGQADPQWSLSAHRHL